MTREEFNQLRTYTDKKCPDCGSDATQPALNCACLNSKHIMKHHHTCYEKKMRMRYDSLYFKKNSEKEWVCLGKVNDEPLGLIVCDNDLCIYYYRTWSTIVLKELQLLEIYSFLKQVNK